MIVYSIIITALIFVLFLSSVSARESVTKRTINGVEEYACLLVNETNLFITVSIDGKKMGIFKPMVNDNLREGSVIKIWLSAKPHILTALGFSSMSDVSKNKPSFKTDEIVFDIGNHIDKKQNTTGPFRIPTISLEEIHFKPMLNIYERNGYK